MPDNTYIKPIRIALKRFPVKLKEFFTELLVYSNLELILLDKDLNIISASPLFYIKTEFNPQDLSGTVLKKTFPEIWQLLKRFGSEKDLSQRKEFSEIVCKTASGKSLSGVVIATKYQNKNHNFILLNFTQLKYRKDNNLLNETGKFQDFILRLTGRGIWVLNSASRQFFGSQRSLDLLGVRSKSNVIPFSNVLNSISSIEEREGLEKDIIKVEETLEPVISDFRVRIRDKDTNGLRYVRMNMQKLEYTGPNIIAGTMDDITEFKQTEKELIKSRARLEKADRFKSVFLSNLSYEIRTPMNAILGYSELLNQTGLSRKEISDFTSVIRSNGSYLLALIDDAIELSRFKSGNIEFSYSEFKLMPLLQDLYNEFDKRRIEKGKTNIELELDVPDDATDYLIYTDYGRLHQSLSNLLSNALKFTEKGKVVFGFKHSPKNVKFFVTDTGIGLTKEDERKIFNRFEVIEETSIRKPSGTGLSLTISKHIIEQLGGKIKVKSILNEGSRFQLSLPAISPLRKKQKSPEEEYEESLHYNWKDKLILIAEDEDMNYKFLEAILQKTQVQVLRARNGQEAVELCRKISQIDLVLMDIKMPVMSGYDAAIEIKKFRTDIPIIAQTAYTGQDDILKCQRAGCEDYIAKPIDIKILVKKINEQFLR